MVRPFEEATIVLLEARMSSELSALIERHGGRARCVPAVREVPAAESKRQARTLLTQLATGKIQVVIFYTGVGVNALLRESERLGQLTTLLEHLRKVRLICRGPKPAAVLKKYDLPVYRSAREPYTTDELLSAITGLDLHDRGVAVVHYGERNPLLVAHLQERGALVTELCLYEWHLPEDTTALRQVINDLISGQVDALLLTSQVQVHHLFQVADEMERRQALIRALRREIVVASIGPTCTEALHSYGILPQVVPHHPKMGHLVKALASYMNGRT